MKTTILRQQGLITHVVVRLSLYGEDTDFFSADEVEQDARIEEVVRATLRQDGEDPAEWQVEADGQAEFRCFDGQSTRIIEVWRR